MKWNNKKPYLYGMLAGFGAISLSVLFFFLIYRYQGFSGAIRQLMGILAPFVYGFVIAYLLKPVCNTYDGFLQTHLPARLKKAASPLAVGGSMLTALLIVYLLFIMIIPQTVTSIISLINIIPGRVKTFVAWVSHYFENDPVLLNYLNTGYASIADSLNTWVRTTLVPYLQEMAGGVGIGVLNFVNLLKNISIGLIVAIYLLLSRHKFSRQGKLVLYSVVRRDWADSLREELRYADKMFEGFINGKLLDSLIIGVICYVFTLITGMNNALLISVIIGLTNIIPFFGPFIGAIPSLLLILMYSPMKALWFLIFIIILQQVDGNIIGPRILGNTTGLSSFWVLFSILLFSGLWGFVGMIIGVPVFAVIYDVLRKLIIRGLHRNGCDAMLVRYNQLYGDAPAQAAPPAASAPDAPQA